MFGLDAEDCTFIENQAQDGGAMFGGSATYCNFSQNFGSDGGAMNGGSATYCNFSQNFGSDGGALYNVSATDCNFSQNFAFNNGGAMYGGSATDCIFENNIATAWAGAVYNGTVKTSRLTNNQAYDGSGMFFGEATLCIFENNNYVETYIVPAKLNVNNFASTYNSGDKLLFNITIGNETFDDINTTIEIYQNDSLLNTYYGLTGKGWVVNLSLGIYEAHLSVKEAGVSKATSKIRIYDPNPSLSASDLVMNYNEGSSWNVTLTDSNGDAISGAVIKIGIAGKVYKRVTDADGIARLPINLNPGTYEINATFDETDIYSSAFTNATLTVNKNAAVLNGKNLTMTYKDGSSWFVTLTDADANPIAGAYVNVTLKDKVYRIKTNASGIAKLAINLLPGTYDISASFANNKLEAETINASITVEKASPVLAGSDVVMEYKDGTSYSVNLTDAEGNAIANSVVKITIGDKTYSRKTDENGVASLPINLAIGNYIISAKFEGNSKYGEVEINNTIVVNKPELSIAAEDVNMTYKDGTSYSVQLTDSQGNPMAIAGEIVNITIKGKTYERKTNANGVASLPINLAAGTYEITAEYCGKTINSTVIVNKA